MPEEPIGSERPGEEQMEQEEQAQHGRDPVGPAAGGPAPGGPPPADPGPAQSGPGSVGERPAQERSDPGVDHGYPPPGQGYPPPGHGPGAGQGYPPRGQGYPPPGGYQGPGGYQPPGGYHGPGGYPPQAARRLTRRTDDRVIGGVASGLGLYFGIDPVIFRIGFVALTLAGGAGLLVYLLLWAVLPGVANDGVHGPVPSPPPRQGEPPILTTLRQGGFKSYVAVGAIVLAVLLLISPFARPTVVFALLLIGAGILLMVHDRPEQAGGPPGPGQPGQPGQPGHPGQPWQPWQGPPAPPPGGNPGPGGGWNQGPGPQQGPEPPGAEPEPAGWEGAPESPSPASTATTTRIAVQDEPREAGSAPGWTYGAGGTAGGTAGTWGAASPPGPPGGWGQSGWGAPAANPPGAWGSTATTVAARDRQPRERSVLGWLTVAAALLAAGITTALGNLGAFDVTAGRVLAVALTVVGIGLLVGSLWGRAWWLILLGLVLVPTAAFTGLINGLPVTGQGGDQVVQPLTVAGIEPSYQLGGGHLTLDLRQVDFGAKPVVVNAKVTAGQLDVLLPPHQPVTVNSRIAAGQIDVLGRQSGGIQIQNKVTEPGAEQLGQLELTLRVGLGQIRVIRG
jgi:phage shock protein PspC (stress-responsive transcriptional regulator)